MDEVNFDEWAKVGGLGKLLCKLAVVDEFHVAIEFLLQLIQMVGLILPGQMIGDTQRHGAIFAATDEIDDVGFVDRHVSTRSPSNENKLRDGHRNRASLETKRFYSRKR